MTNAHQALTMCVHFRDVTISPSRHNYVYAYLAMSSDHVNTTITGDPPSRVLQPARC